MNLNSTQKKLLSACNLLIKWLSTYMHNLRLFSKWIKSRITKDKSRGPQRLQTELVKTLSYKDYFEYTTKEKKTNHYVFGARQISYGEMIDLAFDISKRNVLDIGCAGGSIVLAFYQRGAIAYGCDINETILKKSPFLEIKDNLIIIDTVELPKIFKENTFDFIHSHQVFEHFPDWDYSVEVVKGIKRLLKPGGIVYISLVCGEHLTYQELLELRKRGHDVDVTHINIWPMEKWRNLFKELGFIDVTDIFCPIIDCYQSNAGFSFFKEYHWHQFCFAKGFSYGYYLKLGEKKILNLLRRQKSYADINIYEEVIQTREVNPEIGGIIKDFCEEKIKKLYHNEQIFLFSLEWNLKILKFGSVEKGHYVLDVGCGIGKLLAKALGIGAKAFGTDVSIAALEEANKRLSSQKGDFALWQISAEKLPQILTKKPDYVSSQNIPETFLKIRNTFDRIFCIDSLKHFKDIEKSLENVVKLLDKNGLAVIMVPLIIPGIEHDQTLQRFFKTDEIIDILTRHFKISTYYTNFELGWPHECFLLQRKEASDITIPSKFRFTEHSYVGDKSFKFYFNWFNSLSGEGRVKIKDNQMTLYSEGYGNTLFYGPYILLARAKGKITFTLSLEKGLDYPSKIARLDIVSWDKDLQDEKMILERWLNLSDISLPDEFSVTLDFITEYERKYEFRIWTEKRVPLYFHKAILSGEIT